MKEGNDKITDDGKLAETINEYFVDIVLSLSITSFRETNNDVNNDNIGDIITTFEGHPRIAATKKRNEKIQ